MSSGTEARRGSSTAIERQKNYEAINRLFRVIGAAEARIDARTHSIDLDIDKMVNLFATSLEKAAASDTKAVIVADMIGGPVEIRENSEIWKHKGIFLIEVTARGCERDGEGSH